jgi:hypothetical protein
MRAAHGTIAGLEVGCLSYVWLCALTRRRDRFLRLSVTTLVAEGAVLVLGRGQCPLGPLQRRLGDPVPMFVLWCGPRAARRAVPLLVGISVAGLVALVLRRPVGTDPMLPRPAATSSRAWVTAGTGRRMLALLPSAGSSSWADRKRDLYPGGRPTDAAKAIHRRFADGPIPRLVPVACVLEVLGRTSGAVTRVPLVIVRFRGSWYLVSMFGEDANWVRNVRSAEGRAVLIHGRRRSVRLVEVPVVDRPPILKRYLLFALGARPHVPVHWRAPRSEFEGAASRFPVFQVVGDVHMQRRLPDRVR